MDCHLWKVFKGYSCALRIQSIIISSDASAIKLTTSNIYYPTLRWSILLDAIVKSCYMTNQASSILLNQTKNSNVFHLPRIPIKSCFNIHLRKLECFLHKINLQNLPTSSYLYLYASELIFALNREGLTPNRNWLSYCLQL